MKFLFFNTPDNELVTIDPNKTTKVCKRNFLSTLFFFFCPCFLATFSGGVIFLPSSSLLLWFDRIGAVKP